MSLYGIQDTTLTDIADAIRSKTGKTASMTPIEMPDEIESISGGGDTTLITKSITANGTYSAEDDDADGYSSVTVNVPTGGGASSWTKVAETTYQVSTTNTSAANVDTWATGRSEIWTSDKIVYVRIRDTAGKREGYYYGTDSFFINSLSINNSANATTSGLHKTYRMSNGTYKSYGYYGTTVYSIWPNTIYNNGNIIFRKRYNATETGIIDGTYKVEIYLLDPPTGAPIFE